MEYHSSVKSEVLHAGALLSQHLLCFQLCPAIDAVLVYVNKKWANMNGEWSCPCLAPTWGHQHGWTLMLHFPFKCLLPAQPWGLRRPEVMVSVHPQTVQMGSLRP